MAKEGIMAVPNQQQQPDLIALETALPNRERIHFYGHFVYRSGRLLFAALNLRRSRDDMAAFNNLIVNHGENPSNTYSSFLRMHFGFLEASVDNVMSASGIIGQYQKKPRRCSLKQAKTLFANIVMEFRRLIDYPNRASLDLTRNNFLQFNDEGQCSVTRTTLSDADLKTYLEDAKLFVGRLVSYVVRN